MRSLQISSTIQEFLGAAQTRDHRPMAMTERETFSFNFNLNTAEMLRKLQRFQWASLGLQSKTFEVGKGTAIHCFVSSALLDEENKSAKETLVLIHGFGADALSGWNSNQIEVLSKHFHLVIPDLIFFGQSFTTNTAERSEIFQADCLKSLADLLSLQSFSVVGHSYGGMVAFWMAARYPEVVENVVIVASGICMTKSDNERLVKEFGANEIKEILIPLDVQDFLKAMDFVHKRKPWLPSFCWKHVFQILNRNRKEREELLKGMIIGSEKANPLPVLDQQVMLIWGDDDRIFPLDQAHRLNRHLGEKAELVVIKDSGHVPQAEKAAQVTEAMLKFLLHK